MNKTSKDYLLDIIREYGWEVELIPYNGHEFARCTMPSSVNGKYSMTFVADTPSDIRDGVDDELYQLKVDDYVKRWKNAKNYYGMPGIPEVSEIEKEGNRIYGSLSDILNDIDNALYQHPKRILDFLSH